jgi:hypothetical protein
MVRSHRLSAESSFLGQTCALCKKSFEIDDVIVICPEDGSRHHDHCWQANGNRCTAYGCTGAGEIGVRVGPTRPPPTPTPSRPTIIPNPAAQTAGPSAPPGSKVRVFPARNFGCARSCLFLAITLLVFLMGAACFGLYTLVDGLMNGGTTGASLVAPVLPALLSLGVLSLRR